MTDFYQTFIEMMATNVSNKMSATKLSSADLENIGQGHNLQNSIYLGCYMTNFNQSFTKMMQ